MVKRSDKCNKGIYQLVRLGPHHYKRISIKKKPNYCQLFRDYFYDFSKEILKTHIDNYGNIDFSSVPLGPYEKIHEFLFKILPAIHNSRIKNEQYHEYTNFLNLRLMQFNSSLDDQVKFYKRPLTLEEEKVFRNEYWGHSINEVYNVIFSDYWGSFNDIITDVTFDTFSFIRNKPLISKFPEGSFKKYFDPLKSSEVLNNVGEAILGLLKYRHNPKMELPKILTENQYVLYKTAKLSPSSFLKVLQFLKGENY